MRDSTPRFAARALVTPAAGALLLAAMAAYAVAFDQGAIGGLLTGAMRDSGGALHELFHDARHLLGVPCH